MRAPRIRLFEDEAFIDGFAGGGGASTGIEMALGYSPDVAINHDREALAMHRANHPKTRHIRASIKTRLVGNSVPPQLAAAVVAANMNVPANEAVA